MVTIIAILIVIISSIALVAFTVIVAGVRRTDRNLSLRDRSADGCASAFARKVLGVGVRQPENSTCHKAEATCNSRVGR
jgi:hypothetical protein